MSKIKFSICLAVLIICFNQSLSAQHLRKPIVQRKPLVVTVRGSSAEPTKFLTPEQKRRDETFNIAWQTLDDYYFDQSFSGLNWNDIKKEFEPRVLAAKSDFELHKLLQEMISRLDRSHLTIIPPEVFTAIETAKIAAKKKERELKETSAASEIKGDDEKVKESDDDFDENVKYGIGVDLRLINDEFVITRVEKDSAGELAGLKTGFIINKINDVSLKELLAKIQLYNPNRKNIKKTIPFEIISYFLDGEKDGIVNLEYLDANDLPKQLKIRRKILPGTLISIGKNYPEQFLRFESESLNDEVGYIKFNLFALPVVEDFCRAIGELKNKKAIILDLRGNFGGILATMTGLGGMLTDNRIDLGTAFYKTGSENMTAFTKAKNYKGKIVVLVDNLTISAAEIFAAALQENNRAIVVGEKTAGEALPSLSLQLPTGAVMQYPIANFKTRKGTLIEGSGVAPDFEIVIDRQSLLADRDNQLESALKLIKEDKAFPKTEAAVKQTAATEIADVSTQPPPIAVEIPKPKRLNTAPKKIEEIAGKDEKSLQIIAEFFKSIGGEENLRKINSYHLQGSTEIAVRGTKTDAQLDIYLQKPDKFAQYYHSNVIGEVKEVYNGKQTFLQSDFGMDGDVPNLSDVVRIQTLYPIFNLLDKNYFKAFKYLGTYDRNGKKLQVIQAKTETDATVGLAFDVETKRLASYVGNYAAMLLNDYRAVGNVSLPFSLENENILKIDVESYEINQPLDPLIFMKKEKCFDRPD